MCSSQGWGMGGNVALDARVSSTRDGAEVGAIRALIRREGWPARRRAGCAGARGPVRAGGAAARGAVARWPRRRATTATLAAESRSGGRPDHADTGLGWPLAVAGLPVATAMAGGIQPSGRGGVELPCLVCGKLFMAQRVDRRTCSPA
jgi:hypothetical protein